MRLMGLQAIYPKPKTSRAAPGHKTYPYIRFNVDDLQPVLDYVKTHGIKVLVSGTGLRPGTTWVHLDTADRAGFVIELMNVLPGTSGRTPQQLEP
jgi:hypothetical protein